MNTCPGWLALVTFCFVYNAWAIPFRQFFRNYQHEDNITAWLVSDYLADLVYLLDILIIKYRIMFMENGFWVKVSCLCHIMYYFVVSGQTKIDKKLC